MLDLAFSEWEYPVEKVWFYYRGILYKGPGYIHWKPESGFHLVSQTWRKTTLSGSVPIGLISYDTNSIRIKIGKDHWAFNSNVRIDDLMLTMRGFLSINLHSLLFIRVVDEAFPKPKSMSLFDVGDSLMLPDVISWETKYSNRFSSTGFYRKFLYEDDSKKVEGYIYQDNFIRMDWDFFGKEYSKGERWRFSKSLCDAMSIVSGKIVSMRYHEMRYGNRVYVELSDEDKRLSFGPFMRFFDERYLNKEMVIKISSLLSLNNIYSEVCRKIFDQMVDAAMQRSRQSQELLIATILEASMRTIYGKPFEHISARKDKFDLNYHVKSFCENFILDNSSPRELRSKWKKIREAVLSAQDRLRDRNAHPDWISNYGGSYSKDSLIRSDHDIELMSKFYGYIILGLAGFRNMEPKLSPYLEKKIFGSNIG